MSIIFSKGEVGWLLDVGRKCSLGVRTPCTGGEKFAVLPRIGALQLFSKVTITRRRTIGAHRRVGADRRVSTTVSKTNKVMVLLTFPHRDRTMAQGVYVSSSGLRLLLPLFAFGTSTSGIMWCLA
ncbi:unnamed protein product [Ectocarpus sp. 13 AM-2016]